MDTLITIATYTSYTIAGLVVALNAIAPLTKTEWDNKALAGLVFVHDKILSLLIPKASVAAAVAKTDTPVK